MKTYQTSRRHVRSVALLLIAVLFWSPLAKGQTDTGSLTIRTTDIDGVGIAGATVTLTDKVRGQSWVKTTTAGGEAFFGSLEPGSYRVAVRHPDFSGEQTQDPVEVRVGVILTLTFTYKFKLHGPFKITSLPEVQIEWSNVGMPHNVTSASRTELLELPNLDNDLTPLLQVVPGAIAAGPASLGRVIIDGKGKDQQISRLDGLDASPLVDLPTGDPTLGVLDSFQKQSVTAQGQTSAVSGAFIPLFGPSTGAVTDTATLGGGISFKFQLYEVFRNDALDARNFFDSDNKSGLRRSQFGGKLAGPIPLNKKLFFFLGYEGIRGRTERNMFEAVPSDAACRCGSGPLVPFLGGYLPPGTTVVPGSSSNPDFLVASRPGRTTSASNAWDARIDFLPFNDAKDAAGDPVPKAKDALIFRFTRQAGEAALPDGVTGRLQRQRVLFVNTLVKVSLVTTNSVHEFKFGLNETRGHADTEIPSSTSPALSSSLIALGGTVNAAGLPGGSQSVPVATLGGLVKGVGRGFDLTPYSLTAAYDMTHSFTFKGGLHVLQAGVEARSIRFSFDRLGGLTYSFQNAAAMRAGTPGTVTFLSDLSGPAPFDGGTGPRHARQQYYMGYVQVMSKLNTPGAAGTPGYNLTLTYGFRYDFFGTARERDDRAVVVDPLTGQFLAPGTPFYRARKNNFEPRFGVTYQLPFKTGLFANTLLQAGVGVYLGAPRIGDLVIPIESDRFSTGSSGGTFPTNPGQMVQSFLSNPDTRQFQPLAFSRDFSTPERAYKWEASVTRMIGEVYDVKLAYSGNAGRNLPLAGIANQIVRVETNPDPTKPAIVIRQFDIISGDQVFKPFGEFFYRTSAGRSSFNAMTISLQKNDSKEIPKQKWLRFKGFKAQYTLSRNVGNASGTTASDPTNFGADYGYNAADARHSFSFSAIYPLAEALERKPSSLLWGWTVAPQVTARSGFPLIVRLDRPDVVYVDGSGNVFASPAAGRQAVINTPGGGATGGTRVPDLIAGVNPYLRNGLELLNPAAFAIPAPGRFGNLKRGQLRGPGTFQLDLALTRRIFDPEKTHKVTADFKIEVFNLLNHTNFNNPTASLPNVLGTDGANNQLQPGAPFTRAAAGAFGVFSAADPGRQIQFSLTFKFNEGP